MDYNLILRDFQECTIPAYKAVRTNNGRCMLIQKQNNFLFGEVQIVEQSKNYFHLILPSGEKRQLSYSGIEKIFANGK